MRFFYKFLAVFSVLMRIAVVASPFAFMFFVGEVGQALIKSTFQMVLLPFFTLALVIGLFFPYIRAYGHRVVLARYRLAASRCSADDRFNKEPTSNHDFNWLIPGTLEYQLHNGRID